MAGSEEVNVELSTQPDIQPSSGDLPSNGLPSPTEFDLNVNAQLAASQQSINDGLASTLASFDSSRTSTGSVGGGGGGAAETLGKAGAKFFGSYAMGQKFVFVLDSSKSMTGDRWIYACQELLDSVSKLEPEQKFYVICFDDKTTCMFNAPMSRASFYVNSEETVKRLKRWLATRRLGPGTLPAPAMQMALKMQPDAIFLLSDGELRDNTLLMLREINGFSTERRQIPIHTVHLMSQDGRLTLQTIAMENAGTFTPVVGGGNF